jgi:hypothetical protein
MEHKFYTPDSKNGQTSLKQHVFIAKKIQPIFSKSYMGNQSLCTKYGLVDDTDNKHLELKEIQGEDFDEKNICLSCYKKLNPSPIK